MEAKQLGTTIEELLNDKIKVLSQEAWHEQFINGDMLYKWLENFSSEEKPLMLFLLSNFMYFDNTCMRELLHRAYEDLYRRPLIFEIRRAKNNITDIGVIKSEYKKILNKTRFVSIGNPAESSSHLLYYYRQENNLKTNLFINAHEIYSHDIDNQTNIKTSVDLDNIERIIFIEDFCGSGEQATEYYDKFVKIIKKICPNIIIELHILFASEDGFDIVMGLGYDDVKVIYKLNSSYKCFHDKSRFFPSPYKNDDDGDLIDKDKCLSICSLYGNKLMPTHPLGYKNGQLLISFHHNTPNNTLPIFWSSNNWNPIFKRYNKNY